MGERGWPESGIPTGEDVLEVLDGRRQLAVLHHHILDVLQAGDRVDALPPVFTDIRQRALDVLNIPQGIVELMEARTHPVQLRLDGCLGWGWVVDRQKKKTMCISTN